MKSLDKTILGAVALTSLGLGIQGASLALNRSNSLRPYTPTGDTPFLVAYYLEGELRTGRLDTLPPGCTFYIEPENETAAIRKLREQKTELKISDRSRSSQTHQITLRTENRNGLTTYQYNCGPDSIEQPQFSRLDSESLAEAARQGLGWASLGLIGLTLLIPRRRRKSQI